MLFRIVSGPRGRVRAIELSTTRALLIGAVALVVIFAIGLLLGRYLLGGHLEQRAFARAIAQQKLDLQAARGQIDGKVDALAARVGALNAQLIRLDALGRQLTERAGLDRGEFNFDEAPPAGGPAGESNVAPMGSAEVPELTELLDRLEAQLDDRQSQLVALDAVLASKELGSRIIPGGLPLIGGWISSHFGYRADPFTGRGDFHAGVDFAAPPGSKVISVGAGTVSFSGWKSGYGYLVEITHPTGYMTRYGHNSRNLVRVGDSVQKGDPIAIIGSTGRSTGTHVHFEVLRDGNVLNPMRYLAAP
jgi:murein DD-endopeptidase MepM/ murein hydrolase activator NlpD